MSEPQEPSILPTESRWKAAGEGRSVYIGTPCKTCKNQYRYTSSGACRVCALMASQAHNRKVRKLLKKSRG